MYNAADTNDKGCDAWCRRWGSQLSAGRLSYIKPDEVLSPHSRGDRQPPGSHLHVLWMELTPSVCPAQQMVHATPG